MLDFRVYTFLELCKTLSYTKTAENLYITQPAVTQHIKYL
ncbi:MAG: LysR family transcriptional regulator [Fusobacterium sp.]|nr:LysR family transcriptional regulator [Fusobacterium sp.]